MTADNEKVVIDLRAKRTEAGWLDWTDRTALAAAPLWFQWLGWVAALAALEYLERKSGSGLVRAATVASILLLLYYFNAFFFRFTLRGLPWVASPRVERVLSLILAGGVAYVSWLLATRVASILAANTR